MLRLTSLKALTLVASGLVSASAYQFIDKEDTTAQVCCQSSTTNLSNCATVNEDPSWYDWLSGESRSAQFHYLDLLELLSRKDEEQASTSFTSTRY